MDILNQVFFKCQRKWYTTRFYIKTLKLSFVLSLRYLVLKLSLQCGNNHLRYAQILQGESLGCGIKGGRGWRVVGDIVCKAKVGSLPTFSEVSYSPFLSTSWPINALLALLGIQDGFENFTVLFFEIVSGNVFFLQISQQGLFLVLMTRQTFDNYRRFRNYSFILRNCIRKRFLLKGFLFYSSKLYQETLSS